jgi:peptide/nickel transport system permease protein
VTSGIGRYLVRRLLAGLLVVWGAATVTFVAVHLVPGQIIDAMLGPGTVATPELRQQVITENGLDQPLLVQYLDKLGDLLTGDLGRSYVQGQPVARLLGEQVGPTVDLALAALVLALALAVVAAILTAGRGRLARAVASVIGLLAVSVPSFWLGIVLLTVFSFQLDVFPAAGDLGPAGLVLPALALALPLAGVLSQVISQELATTEGKPFVMTARARGLGETNLLLRHTLRHAMLPVTTLSGFIVGSLFGGAVLVENIFSRPGLGRVLVDAVGSRDIPVVTALVLLSAVVFVVVNTIVDLLHTLIDPRLADGRGQI